MKKHSLNKEQVTEYAEAELKRLLDPIDDTLYQSIRIQFYPGSNDIRLFIHLHLGEGKIPKEYTSRIQTMLDTIVDTFAMNLYQNHGAHINGVHFIARNNNEVVTYIPDEYK